MVPKSLQRIVRQAAIADIDTKLTLRDAMAALHLANLRFNNAVFLVPDAETNQKEVEALQKLVRDVTMKADRWAKEWLPEYKATNVLLVNKLIAALRAAH